MKEKIIQKQSQQQMQIKKQKIKKTTIKCSIERIERETHHNKISSSVLMRLSLS